MAAEDPTHDPEMMKRIGRFIASGENPNGYYVSAETVLKVVGDVESASEETRARVITALQSLIVGGGFIDSLKLGIALGRLMAETTDSQGVLQIARAVKSLDNVPIITIRGEPVN